MAHAYTPGLKVSKKTVVRKERILPLKGEVVTKVGDIVTRDDVVAKTDLPGNVVSVNVVNMIGCQPQDLANFMLKKEGEKIEKDEVIAESKPLIKWFKTQVKSPMEGTIESISPVTGQVLLREPPHPIEVQAYLNGKIIEVIPEEGVVVETEASFIQGIFGVGGEVWGPLKFAAQNPSDVLTPDMITSEHSGAVVVGGAFACYDTIKKCVEVGVKGLIVGGIHDGDLRQLLGYDLGVAITGNEKIGVTVLLTEGFGEIAIAERTFKNLKDREGEVASISGATQIRAGVIRPEIIIPYDQDAAAQAGEEKEDSNFLEIGTQIRVIRQPYFGKLGKVSDLPTKLTQIESETHARVLEVEFDEGGKAIVPRANVELIQE